MKNLILQNEWHVPPLLLVVGNERSTAVDIAYFDWNHHHQQQQQGGFGQGCVILNDNGTLHCFVDNAKLWWKVDLNAVVVVEKAVRNDDDDDEVKSRCGWFSVQILAQEKVACCLNRSTGAIVTVSIPDDDDDDKIPNKSADPVVELVGEFENGILAAEWSCDCQILALVVNQLEEEQQNHTMLITMTNQFEVLSEVVLDTCSLAAVAAESLPSVVSISWRPDGKWLAILSSSSSSTSSLLTQSVQSPTTTTTTQKKHPTSLVLRIFDPRDLVSTPPAMGRTEDGSGRLLPNLNCPIMAWAGPSCSLLLATVQNLGPNKTNICLVESNGLAHGGFTLRDRKCTVHQMAWSPMTMAGGTTILAIHLSTQIMLPQDNKNNNSDDSYAVEEKVQLWYRSNYHWYLKQEFWFTPSPTTPNTTTTTTPGGRKIARLLWSTAEDDRLTILLRNGSRIIYELRWQDCITSPIHHNTAFVVDGNELLLTPLAQALVPPPMSATRLELEAPIRHIGLVTPRRRCLPSTSSRDDAQEEEKPKLESLDDDNDVVGLVHLSNNSLVVVGRRNVQPQTQKLEPIQVLARIGTDTLRQALASLDNDLTQDIAVRSCPYEFHSLLTTSVHHHENDKLGCRQMVVDFVAVQINQRSGSSVEQIVHLSLSFFSSRSPDNTTSSVIPPPSIQCLDKVPVLNGRVLTLSLWNDVGMPQQSPSMAGRQPHNAVALVQLQDGQLFQYQIGSGGGGTGTTGKIDKGDMETLLEPCPWIVGLRKRDLQQQQQHGGGGGGGDDQFRVIGMSWRRRLYCGEVLLADSVSSFHVSDRYLCYATAAASTCQLKFIAISQLWELDPLMGASDENMAVVSADYEPRNIERGARIVTVLCNKPMVVLQLPRGNLEGVCPRALVLPHVLRELVVHGNYRNALEMMRQEKVDLNLLVDWNPSEFLHKGAKELLDQVSNVDHLNLFISSLRNENVTQTIHVLPQWQLQEFGLFLSPSSTTTQPFDFSSKVNQVCQTLRILMAEKVQVGDALLLPVLSTYAKEDPPQLQAALSLIQSKALESEDGCGCHGGKGVILRNNRPKQPLPLLSHRAQSAFQYLAFLSTYELLFDTALGMYNVDLARAVSRNSQMDPKKYLPLLERYRGLPQYYARYEMDVRLKRYPQALRNLVESANQNEEGRDGGDDGEERIANSFSDSLVLIKKHNLHTLGLELFDQESQKREILTDLGELLLNSGEVDNALTILLTVPEPAPFELILKAARKCRDWRTYFSYAVRLQNYDDDDNIAASSKEYGGVFSLASQAYDLAHEMAAAVVTTAGGKTPEIKEILSDAARIVLDYGNDPVEAVDFLIQAEIWNEAYRVASLHEGRTSPNLIQKCLDAAVAYAHTAMEDLSERVSTFESNMNRFMDVLKLRKEAYVLGLDIVPSETTIPGDDMASLFSASSQVSYLSSASQASVSSTSTSASLSTVITVSSQNSSFSLSGADQLNRHKSKYNVIGQRAGGKQKKAKKQKSKGLSRVVQGSEKDLEGIVSSLESVCLDSSLRQSFADCIVFLIRTRNLSLAIRLYDAYQNALTTIEKGKNRLHQMQLVERRNHEERNRHEGGGTREDFVVHPLEKNVGALPSEPLPLDIRRVVGLVAGTSS